MKSVVRYLKKGSDQFSVGRSWAGLARPGFWPGQSNGFNFIVNVLLSLTSSHIFLQIDGDNQLNDLILSASTPVHFILGSPVVVVQRRCNGINGERNIDGDPIVVAVDGENGGAMMYLPQLQQYTCDLRHTFHNPPPPSINFNPTSNIQTFLKSMNPRDYQVYQS
ncbi:hypothetical protein LguiA_031051 [Lonicera macranthoides]